MINFNTDIINTAHQTSSAQEGEKQKSAAPNMNAFLLKSLENTFISAIHQNQQQMDEANQELKKAAEGQ